MRKFLQLHMLVPYGASNLNRDETGRPKTMKLGTVQRLRVTPQALKRAWRVSEVFADQLEGHLSFRTRRLGDELYQMLTAKGMDEAKAMQTARKIAGLFGSLAKDKKKNDGEQETAENGKTPPAMGRQMAFISPDEWDRAREWAERALNGEEIEPKHSDVLNKVDTAADIAMFGRMLAGQKEYERDGSVQVSPAVTTHKGVVEEDYFTTVDDLSANEDSGAGYLSVQEFGSGVFYLYVCVDYKTLLENLGQEKEIAKMTISALVQAAATVPPRGKRTAYASNALAQYILAERGCYQPVNLTTAFTRPVDGEDLLQESILRLENFHRRISRAYAQESETYVMNLMEGDEGVGTLKELIEFAVQL